MTSTSHFHKRSSLFTMLRVPLFLFYIFATQVIHADQRAYNTRGILDWVMVEERRPFFHAGSWAPFLSQSNIVGENNARFYFYTGFGNGLGPGSAWWHWSTWPIENPVNQGDVLRIETLGSNTSGHDGGGGEGTAGGMTGDPAFGIDENVWYRFAIRCWRPSEGTPNLGYAGQWIRKGSTGEWYLSGIYKIPFAVKGVNGATGFIEGYGHAHGTKEFHFKNCYGHEYGQPISAIQRANKCYVYWNADNTAAGGSWKGGYAGLSADGTYAIASSTVNVPAGSQADADAEMAINPNFPEPKYPVNSAGNQVMVEIVNQPATPPFDPIVVSSSSVKVTGSQMIVNWESPNTSSPQLSYKIEVFDNAAYSGSPSKIIDYRDPLARQALLDITGINTPYVRLTISDIFNNVGTPLLLTPAPVVLKPATTVSSAVNGLSYQYYEAAEDVSFITVPDFSVLTPVLQGGVNNIDTSPRQRRRQYAFSYEGYIEVPSDGIYTFALTSFDSSMLFIDNVKVIDFNGLHQRSTKEGWIALAAGKHAIKVQYAFSEQRGQTGNWDDVKLEYSGSGIVKTLVPDTALWRVKSSGEPTITLLTPTNGSTVSGGNINLTSSVVDNGAALEKVQYFVGNIFWGESNTPPYSLDAFVGEEANQQFRARLYYNSGYTVDSFPPSIVSIENENVAPWTLTALGLLHHFPTGGKVNGGEISIVGDSTNMMTRQVTGDCTLIAHLTEITQSRPLPDGSVPLTSGKAGIILRSSLAPRPSNPLGGGDIRFVAAFGQSNGGIYYQDITMRGGNGAPDRTSSNLGGENKWLKIQRVGDTFNTSISADGVDWKLQNSVTLSGIGDTLYAGMFNFTSSNLYPYVPHASFEDVSLSGNVIGDSSVMVSPGVARVSIGQSKTFTASLVGQSNVTYQWKFNGNDIAGATSSSLTLNNIQSADAGGYSVVVTLANGNGSISSNTATLNIVTPFVWDADTSTAGVQDGSGNWDFATAHWMKAASNVMWKNDFVASFGANTSGSHTVTLSQDVEPFAMAFNNTASGHYTLTGPGKIISNNTPLPIQTISDATINGVFIGNGGLRKIGNGTLIFNGGNSYTSTGGLFIDAGTVVLNTPSYNSYPGGGIYLNDGSTLKISQSGGARRYDFSNTGFYFNSSGGNTVDSGDNVNWVFFGGNRFFTKGGTRNFLTGASGINLNGNRVDFNIERGVDSSDLRVDCPLWNTGELTKLGSGILELAANNSFAGTTTVKDGTLLMGSSGVLKDGSLNVNSGATLAGIGTINEPTTIDSGATLSPGENGIGTLTINGTLTLKGTTHLQLNKTGLTLTSDKIKGGGALSAGGTLTVIASGDTLKNGDRFKLFDMTSYSGSFTTINLPPTLAYLPWDTSKLLTEGIIILGDSTLPLTYPVDNYGTLSAKSVDEYIDRVKFGSIDNTSGNDGGYGDFKSLVAHVAIGSDVAYEFTPKWTSAIYAEGWTVWIDLNRDGDFADAGEQVLILEKNKLVRSGTLTIPASATPGATRMRICMRYNGNATSPTGSATKYGEVEDYSLVLEVVNTPPSFTSSPFHKADIYAGPSYSGTLAGDATDAQGQTMTFLKISGPAWLSIASNGDLTGTPGLSEIGTHSFQVQVSDTSGANTQATVTITVKDPLGQDSDSDGLDDKWELTHFGDLTSQTGSGDPDGDGLTNAEELQNGVNPLSGDSDSDGFSDKFEVSQGSDPADATSKPKTPLLAAFWGFNDASTTTKAYDQIHAIVGDVKGNAAYTTDKGGRSGTSGDFGMDFGNSGTAAHINITDVAFLNTAAGNDQLTISFWQKRSDISASSSFWAISPSSSSGYRGLQAHVPWLNNTIYFDMGGAGSYQRISASGSSITWANWNYIALVKKGSTSEIWVNGVKLHSITGLLPLKTDITSLILGNNGSKAQSIHGVLDDFAIFRTSLEPSQIAALANGASPLSIKADSDLDTLDDAWEKQHYGDLATAASDDTDGDGWTSFQEMVFGMNPKVADAANSPIQSQIVDVEGVEKLQVKFRRPQNYATLGVTYALQSSNDLNGANWVDVTDITPTLTIEGNNEWIAYTVPLPTGTETRKFYRCIVRLK